jgi:hypothetical protein
VNKGLFFRSDSDEYDVTTQIYQFSPSIKTLASVLPHQPENAFFFNI